MEYREYFLIVIVRVEKADVYLRHSQASMTELFRDNR